MMKIGCCTNMIASLPDGTGAEHIELLKKTGFDYVELPLAQVMGLSDDKFSRLIERLDVAGIGCEALNNFFPANIRLTGGDMDPGRIISYLEVALERAKLLGAKIIVFGSSGAKNVPEGFPAGKAWRQLVELLRYLAGLAELSGIDIVIEPLNRSESNIITTVNEALALLKEVNRKSIRLLVDYYHLVIEKEPLQHAASAGEYITHIHFSRPEGRVYPKLTDGGGYADFFSVIKGLNYNGGISLEAYSDDVEKDLRGSLELLKSFN